MWPPENVKKQSSRLYFEEHSHPLETYPKGSRYSSIIPNYDDCNQNSRGYHHGVKIPSFDGFLILEEFLQWIDRVDEFFEFVEVEWDKQAFLVASKLKGFAVYWWKQSQNQRAHEGKQKIKSWAKMKIKLEKFFLVCFEEKKHSHFCQESLTCWVPDSIRTKGAYGEHDVVESNNKHNWLYNTWGKEGAAVEDVNEESKEAIAQMAGSTGCLSPKALLEPPVNAFVEINCDNGTIGEQMTTLESDLAENVIVCEVSSGVYEQPTRQLVGNQAINEDHGIEAPKERCFEHGDEMQVAQDVPYVDIFTVGCVMAKFFLDGQPLLALSQMLAYCKGKYDSSLHLEKIPDSGIRKMILYMSQLELESRLSAVSYLQEYMTVDFANYFSPFLHNFYCCWNPLHSDRRVPLCQRVVHETFRHKTGNRSAEEYSTRLGVTSNDNTKSGKPQKIEIFLEDNMAMKPSRYTCADIKKLTIEFMEKLGEGAYGTKFKDKLSNAIFVAVKILNHSNGIGEEFVNGVGKMVGIHLVNVVLLVGCCADGFRRALVVYDFLLNNSLEKYVSSDYGGTNHSLSWETLQKISLGLTKGMEYLHQGCDQRNFGNVSYKSHVYSFGMLVLDMVQRRKSGNVKNEFSGMPLVNKERFCWQEKSDATNVQEKSDATKVVSGLKLVYSRFNVIRECNLWVDPFLEIIFLWKKRKKKK